MKIKKLKSGKIGSESHSALMEMKINEIIDRLNSDKPDKLQELREWVEENQIPLFRNDKFEGNKKITYPMVIADDLLDKIKELMK